MLPIIKLNVCGRINRRDARDHLPLGDVLVRENMLVEGVGDDKRCKKMAGSDRASLNDLGGNYTSGYRYYAGAIAKTFAFNDFKKALYFVDENGNETSVQNLPSPGNVAYPVWEEMKVASAYKLFVSDGFNGMYSHDGNVGQTFIKEPAVTLNFVGMIAHLDRLFGFEEGSDSLYGSVTLNPTNFTDSTDAFVINIGSKRGSKIQRIVKFLNTFFIFKDDSVWVLEGTTPSNFSVREILPNLGLAPRDGIAVTPSSIIFLASDFEVYQFQGTVGSLKLLTFNLSLGGDKSKDLVEIINKDRMPQVKACYHNYLFRMSMVETGETQNNLEYIYNMTNETDTLTRGNNVSCYIVYDKPQDKGKLLTGRSDGIGYLMNQYQGLNWDNQATNLTMPVKLLSAFVGDEDDTANTRFKRLWSDIQVLGARGLEVDYYLDTRLAKTSSKKVTLITQGETKNITNNIRVNNQTSIVSRAILHWAFSQGQTLACGLDFDYPNIDLSLTSFFSETIKKGRKRSQYVGV